MCIHKVIPKCQSTRFHTAKFLVMLIAIIIIVVLFIVVIIFWLWNVPPLAEVVENGTYSDYCACPLWGEANFAVEDRKPTFHLPNSSLHNISCMFVCSKENS